MLGCNDESGQENQPSNVGGTPFHSDELYLQCTLPSGWAVTEGPVLLAHPFSGQLAFNSWGEEGFWAKAITTESATRYSPDTVLQQMSEGGVYVVLMEVGGPPRPPEAYDDEYESQPLDDLLQEEDCWRKSEPDVCTMEVSFIKWGRSLEIEIYRNQNASEEVTDELKTLLDSWRFEAVPAGDIGWAVTQARKLLPAGVEPSLFPIGDSSWSSAGDEAATTRGTQAKIEGDMVVVTFIYRWGDPVQNGIHKDCDDERCHWWTFEAMPTGDVLLIDEGGAGLPDFDG